MEENQSIDFTEKTMEEWAAWVDGRLREQFSKMKIGYSEDLIQSLSYETFVKGMLSAEYRLSFLQYGRMVDMGKGRMAKDGVSVNRREMIRISGNKAILTRERVAKKWYSKTTYGSINRLINALVNGVSPAISDSIKNTLEK